MGRSPAQNIADRKLVQEELRFKESIIQCSSSVIATCELNGNMTYGNPSFLRDWGFDHPGEFLGRPFWEFWLVADRLGEIMQALRTHGIWFGEIKAKRKDGEIFDVQVSAATVFDGQGNVVALTSTSIDITERKRAEEALRNSEQRLRLAIRTAGLAIWDFDVAENTTSWDDPQETVFDGPPEKTTYEWWAERIHPEDRKAVESAFNDALIRGGESFLAEYRFRRADGSWANLYDHSHIMRGQSNRAYRVIGAVMDVTELRRAEEELRQARDELEERVRERTAELSQTIDTLNAEIARRITVEQVLQGRTEQLRMMASRLTLTEQRERRQLAQVLHDGLQQILVGAKHRLALAARGQNVPLALEQAAELIDDAIETSRTLTAELSPPILLRGDLVSALEYLARWMHDKHELDANLIVRRKIQPVTEEVLLLLFQAARELLFNVVKHAGVRSARIEVNQLDGQIEMTIADAGAGFDASRLHSAGGSSGGIGLLGIRERIFYLGGRMEIDSAPGRGSRFKLIAPLSAVSAETGRPSGGRQVQNSVAMAHQCESKPAEAEKKTRIVLVDDHVVVRQGIAGLIRGEADFEIVGEAADGESAVNLVRETRPDIVLVDIGLPGMDGIQVTRIIHKELPEIRIIGLSMFQEGEQRAAMQEAGAVRYLAKSGPSEAIIETIRSCI